MTLFKRLSGIILAAMVAFTVCACAPTPTKEGTGGYIDDTVITAKVKADLLADPQLKSMAISVETFKGRVQLSGFISSPQVAERAVEVTRKVPGVRDVVNNLLVK